MQIAAPVLRSAHCYNYNQLRFLKKYVTKKITNTYNVIMAKSNHTRRWKTLVHKVEYLRLEIEEKKDVLVSVEEEFNRQYHQRLKELEPQLENDKEQNLCKEISINDSPQVEVKEEKNTADIPPFDDVESSNVKGDQEDFKKIWKLIAAKTHPDKTGGDEELTTLYQQAQAAWQNGDYEVLIDIASQLSIKPPTPNDNMITVMQNRAESLQDELKKFESSILWDWSQASEEKKRVIIDHLIRFRKMKSTK